MSYDPNDPRWDSDEALQNLKMEKTLRPDETYEELTRRLLEEASPQAAQSIIHLALHGTNENTRLNAAKYITDSLIGNDANGPTKQKWEELVADAVSDAEVHANVGTSDTETE